MRYSAIWTYFVPGFWLKIIWAYNFQSWNISEILRLAACMFLEYCREIIKVVKTRFVGNLFYGFAAVVQKFLCVSDFTLNNILPRCYSNGFLKFPDKMKFWHTCTFGHFVYIIRVWIDCLLDIGFFHLVRDGTSLNLQEQTIKQPSFLPSNSP